jgi:ketosteroid isomerase-like protein
VKTKHLITLVLFFLFGCAKQELLQMSSQQQETAKKEIKNVINQIFQNLDKLDAEALFQSYSDSPDFILFTTDGSMVDYQAAKNHHTVWFKSLSSLKVTSEKDEFRFLPGNIVIYTWTGNFELKLKAGGEPKINFGITFVFSNIDNRWKVTYQHTSVLK